MPSEIPCALSGSFAGSGVALVITLQTTFPALSPPPSQEPPIGTHRFSIFSNAAWEIVLIAVSLACMLMLPFVALSASISILTPALPLYVLPVLFTLG